MEKLIDLDAMKVAVEALLTSSDTLCVGIRDSLRHVDADNYLNYEQGRALKAEANSINNLIQDFLGLIDELKEEQEVALKDEQEALQEQDETVA